MRTPIRVRWHLLSAVLFLLVLRPAPAVAQPSDSAAVRAAFDRVVTANTHTATLQDGRLTGPGADWLEARARPSQ